MRALSFNVFDNLYVAVTLLKTLSKEQTNYKVPM